MKKQIELNGKKIEYTLKISKRAKKMRLAVCCGGDLVVTISHRMKESVAEKFMAKKADWIIEKVAYFGQFKKAVSPKEDKKNYLEHRDEALELVEKRIEYLNKSLGYSFNKINIRNQKTRWGSCSCKGNLNFNYRVLFLPENVRDYIIVHELCHLKELNHSRRFWSLVKKVFPDYLNTKKELRKSGLLVS